MDMKSFFEVVDARPFRPFEVDLINGRTIKVEHPENLHFFPGREKVRVIWVYYREPEDYSLFYPEGIATIHVRKAGNGNGGAP